MLKRFIGVGLSINLARSVIDNVFRPQVKGKFGSIVYCDLAFGLMEHSGIYVGNDSIVHLNRKGMIEKVSIDNFIKGTSAISIYVSSYNGQSLGSEKVGNAALSKVGSKVRYNVLTKNCHQFSSGCITQDFNNQDLLLSLLKQTSKEQLGVNEWLVLEH